MTLGSEADRYEIAITCYGAPPGALRLGSGWFPPEHDGSEVFRWTAPAFALALPAAGRVEIDYAWPEFFGPADCVISGPAGSIDLQMHAGRHRLVVELGSVLRGPGSVRFSLSNPGRAAGDDRELGLCIFGVTITAEISFKYDGAPPSSLGCGDGWFPAEHSGREAFCWTAPRFEVVISADARRLAIDYARPDFFPEAACVISGPRGSVELPVHSGRDRLVVDLPPLLSGPGALTFSLSTVGHAEGDAREFGLCIFGMTLVGEGSSAGAGAVMEDPVRIGRGWFPVEHDGRRTFRWTEPKFEVTTSGVAECLVIDCARPHVFGAAECIISGPRGSVRLPVYPGWYKLAVELGPLLDGPGTLSFSMSKTGRAEGDGRELGLIVYSVALASGDAAEMARRDRSIANLASIVESPPRVLSIAASDQCNLRCVMCGTHHKQDGDNNEGRAHFGADLIDKIRPLAGGAEFVQLHGGAGEPLFNPQFWRLADAFSGLRDTGADVEIHTNGLLLTPRNIRRLIESRITHVSLSFDAATEPLYRRVRGGDFSRLLSNVRNLVAARAQSGRTDLRLSANMTVFLANVHEAPALVALAHELGLDAVLLMHLNGGDAYNWVETKQDDGWVFDYRANLPEADPPRVMGYVNEARRLAAALDLKLTVDSRFDVYGISIVETPAVAIEEPAAAPAGDNSPDLSKPTAWAPPGPTALNSSRPRTASPGLLRRLINFRKKLSSRTVAAGPHPAAAWVPSPVQSSSPIAATAPRETAPPPAEPNAAEAAPPRYSACREPWRWLNIAANGDVLPCCWAVQPLGNLNEVGSLADIWNGEKMVELRDDIRENRVNKHVCVGASCVYVAR